ncbi:MAG: hypothetical protein JW982_05115 [Spirochaetes bacterium]|nr:hypothetical protein [Spirochaetota bacterium]
METVFSLSELKENIELLKIKADKPCTFENSSPSIISLLEDELRILPLFNNVSTAEIGPQKSMFESYIQNDYLPLLSKCKADLFNSLLNYEPKKDLIPFISTFMDYMQDFSRAYQFKEEVKLLLISVLQEDNFDYFKNLIATGNENDFLKALNHINQLQLKSRILNSIENISEIIEKFVSGSIDLYHKSGASSPVFQFIQNYSPYVNPDLFIPFQEIISDFFSKDIDITERKNEFILFSISTIPEEIISKFDFGTVSKMIPGIIKTAETIISGDDFNNFDLMSRIIKKFAPKDKTAKALLKKLKQ